MEQAELGGEMIVSARGGVAETDCILALIKPIIFQHLWAS